MRPITDVLIEAGVIGLMNMFIVWVFTKIPSMRKIPLLWKLFIAGALIHLLFEVVGANEWWCKKTY